MARRRAWRGPLLVVVLVVLPGCYTYHEADPATLEPGEEVRVQVGSDQLQGAAFGSAFFGPRSLEGRFSELTDESLVVSVWVGAAYQGTPFETAYQDVEIPRDELTVVENRQLSRGRTAVATAGTLALVAYMIHTLELTTFTGNGGDDHPEPPAQNGMELNLRFW